jgi:hypothetical protein
MPLLQTDHCLLSGVGRLDVQGFRVRLYFGGISPGVGTMQANRASFSPMTPFQGWSA